MEMACDQELKAYAEKVVAWATSDEGEEMLRKNLENAEKTVAFLDAARAVDLQRMREPYTL